MRIRTGLDERRLRDLIQAQYGAVTRNQLHECGMSRGEIQYLIRPGGEWQRLLPGIYAVDEAITTQRREAAAWLHAGPAAVITGPYAVRHFGLTATGPTTVDVLVPGDVRRMSTSFVRLIRTTRMPRDVYTMGPIRLAGPARAIADAVRGYDEIRNARDLVCRALLKETCTFTDLATELKEGPSQGSLLLRRSLRDAAKGIWSAAEGDLLDLIRRSDLPEPECNVTLYAAAGDFLGVVDAWWKHAGVAAEVDSSEYHLGTEDKDRTETRHNRITRHRVQLLHFSPKRIKASPDTVLADLRTALAVGSTCPPPPIQAIPHRAYGAIGLQ